MSRKESGGGGKATQKLFLVISGPRPELGLEAQASDWLKLAQPGPLIGQRYPGNISLYSYSYCVQGEIEGESNWF